MQVKQRLKMNLIFSTTIVFVVFIILFLALNRINKANDVEKIAGDIILNAFERVTLRNDYLQNNNARAKAQWYARHEAIGSILESASKDFQATGDKDTVDKLFRNQESIKKIFSAIVENREKKKTSSDDTAISEEVEERLLNQLNIKVYEEVMHGRGLLESGREARSSATALAGTGIACALVILIAAVIINSWFMDRTITDRVLRLRAGASEIGGGNLDYRIDVRGDDEFAELAGAFNAMTSRLKTTYHELSDEVEERKSAEADVLKLSEDMTARNLELEAANKEMESFIYSISHDLRAPVRHIASFARIIIEDYADRLDDQGKDYLNRIRAGTEKMSLLIADLLDLSKISRQEIARVEIDLTLLALSIVSGLRESDPGRRVDVKIMEGLTAFADRRLMEIVLSNLLENAWKFTAKTENACIEFGAKPPLPSHQEGPIYFIKDNGAGFNPEFSEKMFLPFHRLHADNEFEGTGIGLAIVARIILRHGGRIWAEGEPGRGAVVYYTLG